jgi:hypothetical protein
VGHGVVGFAAGVVVPGAVTVGNGTEGGGAVAVGAACGRPLPHETSRPAAAIAPRAPRLLAIDGLSAEMAPKIGEEA